MSAIPKKVGAKANGKEASVVAEAEVGVLLNEMVHALGAPSPFVVGGPLLSPTTAPVLPSPSSSSSSSSSPANPIRIFTDPAQRNEEMAKLKRKLAQLEDQDRAAVAASTAAMASSTTLAIPNSMLMDYIKTVEANRAKEAAEASLAREFARKEEVKSYEALSKKLSKKDDKAKFNLKQTSILLGTGEALQALAEGCSFVYISIVLAYVLSCYVYTV